MTQSQYLEQEVARWKQQFKDHKAKLDVEWIQNTHEAPAVITWGKPGTSINSIRFIISGGYLCAVGDLGDAVLQWSENITPHFLATCDFHYWFSKKRAWPGENGWRQWNARVAAAWAIEQLNYYLATDKGEVPEWCSELVEQGGDMDEFISAADSCGHDDWETASEIREAGLVPDCRAISEWVGLQMALHQLGFRKEAL